MNRLLQFFGICFIVSVCYVVFTSKDEGKTAVEYAASEGVLPQKITSYNIDKQFSFADELLPMDNFDVRERLDQELIVNAYYHSSTLRLLKRSKRAFEVIEPILKEEGIPDDFKYLAVAESALTNAVSPAGARGVWQFMERTGEAYGLEVNRYIDERYHLEKSTRAACQLLKDYHKRFGNWIFAAMAYNAGETRLARTIDEQRATSFEDINMNSETMRYIFRIVALKEILSYPNKFGFYIDSKDYYQSLPAYKTIEVDTTIEDLAAFVESYGVSYRALKIYNPWLLDNKLPNRSRRNYTLRIPYP